MNKNEINSDYVQVLPAEPLPETVLTTTSTEDKDFVFHETESNPEQTKDVAADGIPTAQQLVDRIVAPHKNISKEVTNDDIDYVLANAQVLVDLCFMTNGLYASAYAMAHPQIEVNNPLRFFALSSGLVVCNPKIVRHTKHPVDSEEGCMTAPHLPKKMVQRYHKIEVEYQTILDDKKLSPVMTVALQGPQAKVWQHEIGHLNGHYIFDEDFKVEGSL